MGYPHVVEVGFLGSGNHLNVKTGLLFRPLQKFRLVLRLPDCRRRYRNHLESRILITDGTKFPQCIQRSFYRFLFQCLLRTHLRREADVAFNILLGHGLIIREQFTNFQPDRVGTKINHRESSRLCH